jgi:hypothetical protein
MAGCVQGRNVLSLFCLVMGLTSLSLMSGCGAVDPQDSLAAVNSNNIQRLANLYFTYQSRNDWRGPANEAQFKAFLKNYNPEKLKRIGLEASTIDQLFINERDGQSFKIRYGVPGSAMGSSEPVIFEAEGVDGVRLVGRLNMTQEETDAAKYEELWGSKVNKVAVPERATAGS